MEEETDVVDSVLEGLSHEELKDHIIRNVKEIARLKEDAKAYAKSIREVVKELDRRNEQAVELLERDLKVKVVWALAAEMWLTYHKLSISNPITGWGSLLSGNYEPAS